jgi:hypothetical protein
MDDKEAAHGKTSNPYMTGQRPSVQAYQNYY